MQSPSCFFCDICNAEMSSSMSYCKLLEGRLTISIQDGSRICYRCIERAIAEYFRSVREANRKSKDLSKVIHDAISKGIVVS